MSKTNIAWVDESINPYGWICRETSPGCAHCYAHALAKRAGKDFHSKFYTRWPAAMKEVKAVKPGSTVFLNSCSDTYFAEASDQDVHRVHNLALARPDVTWLILTKRPERAFYMRDVLAWPANLWMGVSVETATYLYRIDYALATPAAHVFISAEPLLSDIGVMLMGYLNTRGYGPARNANVPDDVHDLGQHRAVEWVICGGESGPNRRPFEKRWAASIMHSCLETGVKFFFKQGSAYTPGQDRLLEGHLWDEVPAAFGKPAHLTSTSSPIIGKGSMGGEPVQLDLFGGAS